MRVFLPTDVFPPRCGGAGWSAHTLALALQGRGHDVLATVPRQGATGITHEQVLGVPTVRYGYRVPPIPFVKNYARHERLWPRLAALLVEQGRAANHAEPLVIHAQHVQVTPAAILAGRQLGAPVIATIRDHWPWHYFATGLHGDRVPYERAGAAALATDLVGRLGPLAGVAALPALPYIAAHLRRRQAFLAQADAVVAVSHYIAKRLEGIVAPERIHVIPNMVDTNALEHTLRTPPESIAPGTPYLLAVGKLERNKGAHLLLEAFRAMRAHHAAPHELPELIVAGNGPLRPLLEHGLAELGVRARFLEWVDHDEVVRLMAHCTMLLFPSAWGEPLSRVPLEASACGAPILAMPTGGTRDIITDGVSGALEPTPERFAARLLTLLAQPDLCAAMGAEARRVAQTRFAVAQVLSQYERLYKSLRS